MVAFLLPLQLPAPPLHTRPLPHHRPPVAIAMASASTADSPNPIVLGCGAASVDYLATVASFPNPDDKIRSLALKVQGGGNTGNALTAAARLGLRPRIISKVSNDAQGRNILKELQDDGIDTSYMLVAEDGNSPFTYIIVDNQTKTRTCIHTPGYPPLLPEELTKENLSAALDGADMVYFDVRLHETALIVAEEASHRKIPILIDAEKKREGLDELLNFASYVVCSAKFPQAWTGASSTPVGLVSMLSRLPKIKFVIVTLGEKGCLMLERSTIDASEADKIDIEVLLESLEKKVDESSTTPNCITSKANLRISADEVGSISGRLLLGTAEVIPPDELIDTTGAGDAFIGAVLYGLCTGMPPERMLPFASQVHSVVAVYAKFAGWLRLQRFGGSEQPSSSHRPTSGGLLIKIQGGHRERLLQIKTNYCLRSYYHCRKICVLVHLWQSHDLIYNTISLFAGWFWADKLGWCWCVMREKYCTMVKPWLKSISEQAEYMLICLVTETSTMLQSDWEQPPSSLFIISAINTNMGGKNTERARKALDAMKELGISRKQATPVLKELLATFDNNWEPIEDEHYRALADAIFARQDNKQTSPSQQGAQAAHADSEPNGSTRDDLQQYVYASHDDTGEDDNETPLVKRPRMGTANFRPEPLPFEPGPQQSAVSTQGALPASPQASRRQTRSLTVVPHAAGHEYPLAVDDTLIVKESKPEPQIDIAEVSVGDPLMDRDFLAGPEAIRLNAGSSGSGARGSIVNQAQSIGRSLQPAPVCKNGVGSTVKNTKETSFVEVDVASSANGEVKMSLKCSLDSSNFTISMEEVFKMVEEKCLHSYKVLPPEFSIGKLMSEVCQSYVQLGTMHSEVNRNDGSLHNEVVAPFVKPIACEAAVGINHNVAGGSSVPESSEPCLQNSLVTWDPELAHSKQKTTHDITDISKGEERVRVPIVNEFGSETCPPSFYYVSRNLVFQNACVNISIARIGDEDCCADCFGNCLSASVPCACSRVTGGEFPYTPEGLLKSAFLDECTSVNHFPQEQHRFYCTVCPLERSKNEASPGPCKGHLVRKFIKECWSKCGCGMQCGNRVMQRGIICKLQVFFTREGKGWGVRTVEDLPKGAFVCEYVGEVLTSAELHERAIENARNGKHMHQVLLDAAWGSSVLKDEEALSLDGSFYGNVGRFINHRCYDANLVQIPVEVETPDHHYYHLAFFTNKKVEAFEELTWDYGIDFDDVEGPSKPFRCMCGSRYCRDPKNPRRMGRAAAKLK